MAINARVTQGQAVRVEINKQSKSDVQNINYGLNAIGGANDMSLANDIDGYYIRYNKTTKSFYLSDVTPPQNVDGGTF